MYLCKLCMAPIKDLLASAVKIDCETSIDFIFHIVGSSFPVNIL